MLFQTDTERDAKLSECGRYRFWLTRRWGEGPAMLFIALNPSKADACQDDPTLRRMMAFARREKFAAVEVVNLFALRSTDPAALALYPDPVGDSNDEEIRCAASRAGRIVAAWGCDGTLHDRDRAVMELLRGLDVYCLGTTKDGHPRHPLYVAGNQPLAPFGGRPCR